MMRFAQSPLHPGIKLILLTIAALLALHRVEAATLTLAPAGNSCPSGFEKIKSAGDCRAAMDLLPQVKPNEFAGTENEKKWPSGCYHCDDVDDCEDGFWFNSHRKGKANGGARPVCVSEDDGFESGPSEDQVLFLGDSDIENWDTYDFIPGSENSGIGGHTCKQVLKRTNRELNNNQPAWVVLVCGENDMAYGKSAGAAFKQWKKVVNKITKFGARVLYIGTKPEPDTKELHDEYREYDAKIRAFVADNAEGPLPQVVMVDSYAGFVDVGNPDSLYARDKLHLSSEGYALWEEWARQALDDDTGCIEWRSGDCVESA